MGLPAPVIEMFIKEHLARQITGDVAFIGRHTTFATEKSLRFFEQKYKLCSPVGFNIEIDDQTCTSGKNYKNRIQKYIIRSAPLKLVTDRCLMNFLGVKNFSAIDVSDYEGADIICDLSQPLPKSLYGKFDFIFNGSCLDNIFNPAEAMRNFSRLLRPKGRLMMIEHGSMFNGPYTIFSPGWFFDFFCYNKYQDCNVYHAIVKTMYDVSYGPWSLRLYNWKGNPTGAPPKTRSREQIMYLIVAEKGSDSTDEQLPIQQQYRDPEFEQKIFAPQATRIAEFNRYGFGMARQASISSPFVDCGYLGKGIPF